MDSQLSFSPSGTAKSGLLNLVNKRNKSLAGERPFFVSSFGCWKEVTQAAGMRLEESNGLRSRSDKCAQRIILVAAAGHA
jgi:hypothetical protein